MTLAKIIIPSVLLGLFLSSAFSDDRTHLPKIFKDTYIGLELGLTNVNYTNSFLRPGFAAAKIKGTGLGYHVTIGHYFSPYIAFELTGYWMVPLVKFININNRTKVDSIQTNVIGGVIKPTWPISPSMNVFALLGGGFVSRNNLISQGVLVLQSGVIPTALLGGGFSMELSKVWGLDFSGTYGMGRNSRQLPSFYNVGIGAHFNFSKWV